MQSATVLLHNVPSSFIPNTNTKTAALGMTCHDKAGNLLFRQDKINTSRSCNKPSLKCRVSSGYEFSGMEYNLYELLGIESSSDTRQIKEAYRSLQKRCHPDIAGPPGHDMAIVLNEAYALLSDPNSRMAYDKELAKVEDLQGYTGRPIYSTWSGSESEERAVFVDEVKCIGCLKCALFAQKTFAVESMFGRARVVSQWADPEHQIHDAIAACPVDCISFVERSELPALEFIMSKLPRGKVIIGAANTNGARTTDVFDEVEKFQARYIHHKASKSHSKDFDTQMASRVSTFQAIQMISNWMYWQSQTKDSAPLAIQKFKLSTGQRAPPDLKKLKAVAEARKHISIASQNENLININDYWVPAALALPQATTKNSTSMSEDDLNSSRKRNPRNNDDHLSRKKKESNIPFGWMFPIGTSIVAAVVVNWLQLGEPVTSLPEHVAGSLALEIVNSPWMQVGLVGVTWYLIGMYVLEIVEALWRK